MIATTVFIRDELQNEMNAAAISRTTIELWAIIHVAPPDAPYLPTCCMSVSQSLRGMKFRGEPYTKNQVFLLLGGTLRAAMPCPSSIRGRRRWSTAPRGPAVL